MKRYWVFKAGKMIVLFVGFILLAGVAVMFLWNALIPTIFDGARITLIQALGLLILARILVGGRWRSGFGWHRGSHWRKRWESRIANLSPEERKKWKEEAGRYMCCGDTSDRGEGPADEHGSTEAKAEA